MYTFGNVKYHLSNLNDPGFLRLGFDSINSFENIQVLKNRYYVPFGYTYDKYINYDNFKKLDDFQMQTSLLNAFVFEEEMFYDELCDELNEISLTDTALIIPANKFNFTFYKQFTDKLKEDTLQIKKFEQSKIVAEIDLSKNKLLFLTIPYDNGWQVTDNGQKRKLSRVNFGFSGLVLEQGKHEMILEYVPQYYYISSAISMIFMLLTIVLIIVDTVRKRKIQKTV